MIRIQSIQINQKIDTIIEIKNLETLEKFRKYLEEQAKIDIADNTINILFTVQTDGSDPYIIKGIKK